MYGAKFLEVPLDIFKYVPVKVVCLQCYARFGCLVSAGYSS